MSILKTRVKISEVEEFLRKNFSLDKNNIEILKGGEISQAFSFTKDSIDYVIKVRRVRKRFRKANPFSKELVLSKTLKKKDISIPIPKIVKFGVFYKNKNEKFIYSIVEKAKGKFVHLYQNDKAKNVDKSLIDMLYQIHSIDISKTKGFGNWEKWNEAPFNSMKDQILDVIERQKIFTKERFATGIFEKDLYIQGSKKIKELVKYCSSKRYLVHADYGYDNVLADDEGNITAVYDWEHSMFGDFVYDIAWLDFWGFRVENTYSNLYLQKYQNVHNLDFDSYEERLLCYKIYIGMTAAGFFSESNQEDKYLEAKQRVLSLLLF